MIDRLNDDITRTEMNMIKVDSKMKELIANSNQCCLWTIIIIELIVLIVSFI